MTTLLRFFTSIDDEAIATYKDCDIIPQIGSKIWLCDTRYKVCGIDYGYPVAETNDNVILADVWIEVTE